ARLEELQMLFARDAVWVTPVGTWTGRRDIYEHLAATERVPDQRRKHLVVNSIVEVHGDTATAVSDGVLVQGGPDIGGTVIRGGRYEDELVKEDGAWRISKRVNHTGAFRSDSAHAGDEIR